jgi:hypothetical protein
MLSWEPNLVLYCLPPFVGTCPCCGGRPSINAIVAIGVGLFFKMNFCIECTAYPIMVYYFCDYAQYRGKKTIAAFKLITAFYREAHSLIILSAAHRSPLHCVQRFFKRALVQSCVFRPLLRKNHDNGFQSQQLERRRLGQIQLACKVPVSQGVDNDSLATGLTDSVDQTGRRR